MNITIVNKSSLLTQADIEPVLVAINQQIAVDFAPLWGIRGIVSCNNAAGNAQFILQDTINDPNALGYHVDQSGIVSAIIDVEACKSSGNDWRTCLGHEVLEALADPLCNRMAPNGRDIIEVCDPVEEDFYQINGIPVTNFVTPAYFGFNNSSTFDKMNRLQSGAPALRPGGYIMQLIGNSWTTHFGKHRGFMANRTNGRRMWRTGKAA